MSIEGGRMSSGTPLDLDSWAMSGPGLLGSIARYKYAIAVATVCIAFIGYMRSASQPPVYRSTATILLSDSSWTQGDGEGDPTRRVEVEANRIRSRAVLKRASELLDDSIDQFALAGLVAVEPVPAVLLIHVHGTANDPEQAAAIANAVTEAYDQTSREAIAEELDSVNEVLETQGTELGTEINRLEDRLEEDPTDAAASARLESLQAQLLALRTRLSEMSADAALYGAGIDEIEAALPPGGPSSPTPIRDAQIAGLLGFVLASALAYWRAIVLARRELDRSALLNAPMLAQIPEFKHTGSGTVAVDPMFDVEVAEAYQFLLTSFEYALAQTGVRSVLITSPRSGDGKSLTALHLARALAVQGRGVLLVDADIRQRGITRMLHAGDEPGLVALAGGQHIDAVMRHYRISQSLKLDVVPSGSPLGGPTGLLGTVEYRKAIGALISSSEITIIDGGPLLTVADASSIAAQVDGVILVLDPRTGEEDLLKVQDRMRLMATPLIGYVLNRVPHVGSAHSYVPMEAKSRRGGLLRRATPDQSTPAPADPTPNVRVPQAGGAPRPTGR